MARLHEWQGKDALKKTGVPVPRGSCVSSASEAKRVASEIGKPVVLKAQVWATGRFGAGGIKFAATPEAAEEAARQLFGAKIKGLAVQNILVEERLAISKEMYVGVIVSDSEKIRGPVLIASTQGGTGIEEIAAKNPESIFKLNIDYLDGISDSDANETAAKMLADVTADAATVSALSAVIRNLYQAFKQHEASAVEINPLVLTKQNALYAADCRFTLDDSAIFRHPEFNIKVPRDMDRAPTRLEEIAWTIEEGDYRGTAYFAQMSPVIKGPDWLGFHGLGGGASMLSATALIARGFKIANYTDTSGDPAASKVYRIIKLIFQQEIDGYVLMGACLANQEQWHHAHGIVKALREVAREKPGFPVVILIAGNKEEEAHQIIRNGLKDLPLDWELYGRDYIYSTDFLSDRIEQLVKRYQKRLAQPTAEESKV